MAFVMLHCQFHHLDIYHPGTQSSSASYVMLNEAKQLFMPASFWTLSMCNLIPTTVPLACMLVDYYLQMRSNLNCSCDLSSVLLQFETKYKHNKIIMLCGFCGRFKQNKEHGNKAEECF